MVGPSRITLVGAIGRIGTLKAFDPEIGSEGPVVSPRKLHSWAVRTYIPAATGLCKWRHCCSHRPQQCPLTIRIAPEGRQQQAASEGGALRLADRNARCAGRQLARVKPEQGSRGPKGRPQSKSCCLRRNETSGSSGRSAMSIVEAVFHRHKLRQERHGPAPRNYRTRRSLAAKHAAPAGAWMASGDSVATNMPLLRSCFAQVLFQRKQRGTVRERLPGRPARIWE